MRAATVAVLLRIVPPATPLLTLVIIAKFAEDPAVRAVATQETVPAEPTAGVVQLQPAGIVIDWNVVLAGTVDVKNTPDASLGPLFVTTCV